MPKWHISENFSGPIFSPIVDGKNQEQDQKQEMERNIRSCVRKFHVVVGKKSPFPVLGKLKLIANYEDIHFQFC